MNITQVEIQTKDGETKVYWLRDNPYDGQGLTVGQRIMLAEEGVPLQEQGGVCWYIKQKWVSVSDEMKPWLIEHLKARVGTILLTRD